MSLPEEELQEDKDSEDTGLPEQKESMPEENTVVKFDLNALYQDPDDPEKQITGADLKSRINRGTMYDKVQSARDKAIEDNKTLASGLQEQEELVAKLTAELEERRATERTMKALADAGITKQQEALGHDEDDTLDPAEIEKTITAIAEDRIGKATEELARRDQQRQEEIYKQQQQQEQVVKEIDEFVSAARAAELQQHKAAYPDVDDSKIIEAMKVAELAEVHNNAMMKALHERDTERAKEEHYQTQANRVLARQKLLELDKEQATIVAKRETDAAMKVVSGGIRPEDAPPPTRGRTKAESAKNRAARIASAKKLAIARMRYENR